MKTIARITILFVLVLLAAACKKKPEPQFIPKWSVVQMLRQQRDELSEWDMLILAISFTESRFRPDAVGKAGDSGHLQLLPVYVDEVNRVSGTEYTINDAFDIDKSLEMFNLLQDYYNKNHDIEEAIRHHNKSPQYRKAVLENLEMIRRYEKIRSRVKAINK